jgi:hypothetical protein
VQKETAVQRMFLETLRAEAAALHESQRASRAEMDKMLGESEQQRQARVRQEEMLEGGAGAEARRATARTRAGTNATPRGAAPGTGRPGTAGGVRAPPARGRARGEGLAAAPAGDGRGRAEVGRNPRPVGPMAARSGEARTALSPRAGRAAWGGPAEGSPGRRHAGGKRPSLNPTG